MESYKTNRFLHIKNDIPEEYKNCSLHIALEKADIKKDWVNFKKIYSLDPEFLMRHLKMTGFIFDYNYENLSDSEKYNLFN